MAYLGYYQKWYFPQKKTTRNQPFKVSSGHPLISIYCLRFHFHLKPGFQIHHDLFINLLSQCFDSHLIAGQSKSTSFLRTLLTHTHFLQIRKAPSGLLRAMLNDSYSIEIDKTWICLPHLAFLCEIMIWLGANNKIHGKCLLRPPAKPGYWYIDDHKHQSTESSDLFDRLNVLIVPFILKTFFTFHRKDNIRYHNHCDNNQAEDI